MFRDAALLFVFRLVDKVVDVLSTRHGAWSGTASPRRSVSRQDSTKVDLKGDQEEDREKEFWKLDVWEDDARRRRR